MRRTLDVGLGLGGRRGFGARDTVKDKRELDPQKGLQPRQVDAQDRLDPVDAVGHGVGMHVECGCGIGRPT